MRSAARLFPPLAATVLISALAVAVWAWLGRPVALPAVPGGHLQCLSYTPSHDDSSPLAPEFTAPPGLVKADMARLKEVTDCVRTYSSLGTQGEVVAAAAAEAGIRVQLGIWISADDKANDEEIEHALAIAATHPGTVQHLIVGNEVLLRREMTSEKLAGIIRSVKARTELPVTYADIFEFWRRNPVVADTVDIVTIHVLPYWDDPTPVGIDDVQAHVRAIVERARETFPGKPMQIGEIGWPSAGRTRGAAAPSRVNEARFLREFAVQAKSLGLPYNIIEAVDQPWKRLPEGTVGGFWGVLDKDRNPKFSLTGPVSEWPNWRMAAVFSIIGGLLSIAATMRLRTTMPTGRWIAVATAGGATAGLLWAFGDQAIAAAIGPVGALWFGYLWLLTAFGGMAVIRIAMGLAENAAPQPVLLRWLVIVPAVTIALLIAVDGRHRDFPTMAFVLPALALIFHDRIRRKDDTAEGWMGTILVLCGPLAVDSPKNLESIAWAACCLALAFPLRNQIAAELRRVFLVLRKKKQAGDHGHG